MTDKKPIRGQTDRGGPSATIKRARRASPQPPTKPRLAVVEAAVRRTAQSVQQDALKDILQHTDDKSTARRRLACRKWWGYWRKAETETGF